MKTKLPLLAYIPIELMFDADMRMKWNEHTEEVMSIIDVGMAERLAV